MYKKFFKRIIDLTISIISMPFVILIIFCVAPFIYLEDKGPIFYNAKRLGKCGKIFTMYKLRTMKENSPNIMTKDGQTFSSDNDVRVTKIGRFLRKTSIDELPQFINVLIGNMSIIGPRAHVVTNYKGVDNLTEKELKRLEVLPGITGYSQAYFRNSATQIEKINNDCYYVDNISFLFDIKIFIKTILSVLKKENINISSFDT